MTTKTTLDTLEYSNIKPIAIEQGEVDSLPTYYFRDTVDGRWSAEVRGRDVEVKSLVLIDQTTYTHSEVSKIPEWEVSVLARTGIDRQWVGLGAERNIGAFTISVGVGYDFVSQTPSMEAQMGVRLWHSK